MAIALLATLAGCIPVPHPVDPATRPAFDARDILKFQYHGSTVAIRAVKFSGDSLSGTNPADSVGGRVSYSIAEVTHAVVEPVDDPSRNAKQSVLFLVGALLVALAILQVSYSHYGGSGS